MLFKLRKRKSISDVPADSPASNKHSWAENFRSYDELGPSILTQLHLDNNTEEKTYTGAAITLLVKFIFFSLMIKNFADMVDRERTHMTTIEKTMQANQTLITDVHGVPRVEQNALGDLATMFFVVKNYTNQQ